jgi:GTPase
MASDLKAETKILRKRKLNTPGGETWAVELLVRKIPADSLSVQHRVAVLGNVDAGKSTLVGVLTNGELDNGRGKSRLQMFRHPHEITSGKTSSISVDILR